jgi:hypothetical protein
VNTRAPWPRPWRPTTSALGARCRAFVLHRSNVAVVLPAGSNTAVSGGKVLCVGQLCPHNPAFGAERVLERRAHRGQGRGDRRPLLVRHDVVCLRCTVSNFAVVLPAGSNAAVGGGKMLRTGQQCPHSPALGAERVLEYVRAVAEAEASDDLRSRGTLPCVVAALFQTLQPRSPWAVPSRADAAGKSAALAGPSCPRNPRPLLGRIHRTP